MARLVDVVMSAGPYCPMVPNLTSIRDVGRVRISVDRIEEVMTDMEAEIRSSLEDPRLALVRHGRLLRHVYGGRYLCPYWLSVPVTVSPNPGHEENRRVVPQDIGCLFVIYVDIRQVEIQN